MNVRTIPPSLPDPVIAGRPLVRIVIVGHVDLG